VLIALAGVSLTAAAAYLGAVSPSASSANIVATWAAIAVSAVALGLYAAISRSPTLPVGLLATCALLWALWLLLVSGHAIAFTIGWLLAGLLVPLVGYQVLSSLSRPASRRARLLLFASAGAVAVGWSFVALTSRQPTLLTPLARCLPACPRNALFAGSAPSALTSLAKAAVQIGWLLAVLDVAGYLARRLKAGASPARRAVAPTLVLSIAYAAAVTACVAIGLAAPQAHPPLAWISVVAATLVPVAMLAGLVWERLFMGEALEEFVNSLRGTAPEDVRALMAQVLHDPSLQIGYAKPATRGYVDPSGASVELPAAHADRAVTPVRHGGLPEAVVIHRDAIPDQERFIRAAGAAALISRENHRLESDLSASTAELAASRKRLVDAAYAERQRIERDIHDGIQQRMVGARVKLELADEALDSNPARGRRMLAEIGCDLDDALEEVRAVAQGVYPALLETHGLVEALRSAARRSPGAVTVRGDIGRYPADTEAAIYFCCLETLQNVAKHAGRDASATVRLWEDGSTLCFQTRDSGVGFATNGTPHGQGLINMHDRLAAVGGALTLKSRAGLGTVVGGCVPIG